MASFALVATVDDEAVGELKLRLSSAPPFDLPQPGISGHQVFLGPEHAVFVFWGDDPEGALLRATGQPDVRERVSEAIAGMRMPRKLDPVFEWIAPQHPDPAGRAVAVVARGVEERPGPHADRLRALVGHLGNGLERARAFAGDGAAVFVLERDGEAQDAASLLPLDALRDGSPVVALRALEVLDQTYWFESAEQHAARPSRGILAVP